MKNILNLLRYLRKNGWAKTKEEWRYNYLMLQTPQTLLKQEIFGYKGAIFGLILAVVVLSIKGVWYLMFVLGFGIFINWVVLKGKLQQLYTLEKLEKEMKEILEVKE